VPTRAPVIVSRESTFPPAMPKSISFTVSGFRRGSASGVMPPRTIMTFAGLMSRWMMPAEWMCCSARTTRFMISMESGTSSSLASMYPSRLRPSTNSITM